MARRFLGDTPDGVRRFKVFVKADFAARRLFRKDIVLTSVFELGEGIGKILVKTID
jgi:hypothetical protein